MTVYVRFCDASGTQQIPDGSSEGENVAIGDRSAATALAGQICEVVTDENCRIHIGGPTVAAGPASVPMFAGTTRNFLCSQGNHCAVGAF